jgi:hypothetical protein
MFLLSTFLSKTLAWRKWLSSIQFNRLIATPNHFRRISLLQIWRWNFQSWFIIRLRGRTTFLLTGLSKKIALLKLNRNLLSNIILRKLLIDQSKRLTQLPKQLCNRAWTPNESAKFLGKAILLTSQKWCFLPNNSNLITLNSLLDPKRN